MIRSAVVTGILLAVVGGSVGAAEDRQPCVVLTFQKLNDAWRTLGEAGVVERLTRSGTASRLGLVKRVAQVRASLLRAELFLGVEVLSSVARIAAGRGYVAVRWEEGQAQFLADLYPSKAVPFPRLLTRLIERDPNTELLAEERHGRSTLKYVRVQKQRFYFVTTRNRLMFSPSKAFVLRLLRERDRREVIPERLWPAGPGQHMRLEAQMRELTRTPGLPVDRVSLLLGVDRKGVEAKAQVEVVSNDVLNAFNALPAAPSALLRRCPAGGLAAMGVRADWPVLYRAVTSRVPPQEQEQLKRRVLGIEQLFLGGQKLTDVLSGIGPEVLLTVWDAHDGALPADFALLTQVRSSAGKRALEALGRALLGVAAFQGGKSSHADVTGGTVHQVKLRNFTIAFGVTAECACVATSEALVTRALEGGSTAGGPGHGDVRDEVPPAHFFAGADTQVTAAWLARHKQQILRGGTGSTEQERQIVAMLDLCRVLQYAGVAAVAGRDGVTATARLQFAP